MSLICITRSETRGYAPKVVAMRYVKRVLFLFQGQAYQHGNRTGRLVGTASNMNAEEYNAMFYNCQAVM